MSYDMSRSLSSSYLMSVLDWVIIDYYMEPGLERMRTFSARATTTDSLKLIIRGRP